MSRAFLKESTLEEPDVRPRGVSALPPGAKNFLTASGRARLERELDDLRRQRAAAAAGAPREDGRPPASADILRLDERIRPLERSLQTAEVVPPPPPAERDRVRFGATVTVRDRHGEESSYRIVGVDEADPAQGAVSYLSPIAQALLNAHLGQRVPFRFPKGRAELEIVAIRYDAA